MTNEQLARKIDISFFLIILAQAMFTIIIVAAVLSRKS